MLPDMSDTPPHLAELAEACVRYVENATKVKLDYTQDTLPVLDHYAAHMPAEPGPDVLALIAPAAGAYFGEVIRRSLGDGRWHAPGTDYDDYRLEFERCFLHFNPVAIAMEALTKRNFGATLEVLDEDREAVSEALDRDGHVDDADYRRFSIRYDVIDRVCSILSARSHARGDHNRRFGPEVYRAAVPPDER